MVEYTPALPSSQPAQPEEMLKPGKVELFDLDTRISSLRSTLDAFQRQKTAIDQMIFDHNMLLAPFRRFPDDVLREIFVSSLPIDHNASMDITEPPFLLGRICSRWRALAYSTPSLWNTLHISSFNPPMGNTTDFWIPPEKLKQLLANFENRLQLHYAAVEEWIERSGVLPLKISISFGRQPQMPELYIDFLLPYFDLLLSCSHRWQTLEMRVPSKACAYVLSSMQNFSFPQLESIYLVFLTSDRVPVDIWTRSRIFNAERLNAICLSQCPCPPTSLSIEWSRFTQIVLHPGHSSKMGRISLQEAFEILRNCQQLQHCGLAIQDHRDRSSPRGVLPLPKLESLILIDHAFQLESLIQCFEVPSLYDITYFTTFPPTMPRRSPLVSLLNVTNGRVRSLSTSLHFYPLQDLLECFTLLPSLTCLTNKRTTWTNVSTRQRTWEIRVNAPYVRRVMKSILFLLLPNSTNLTTGCLCPKLHSLHLLDSHNLADHDALDFIQQRLAASAASSVVSDGDAVCGLRMVEVNFTTHQKADLPASLQPFIDQGLKLALQYPGPRSLLQDSELLPGRHQIVKFDPRQGLIQSPPQPNSLPNLRSLI